MSKTDPAAAEPLYGFLPRNVKGDQVRKALVCQFIFGGNSSFSDSSLQAHDLNPFTKVPHTPQYKKILEARKKLPVFAQMDEFLDMVRPTVILDARRGV